MAEFNQTPTPTSVPGDPAEYPQLAAYAYFRIVPLHLSQGYISDAETVYNTLQEKYPEGSPGHPYAEMAALFWDEYQTSQNLPRACSEAVQYAAGNIDILTSLGRSNYHGLQSKYYGQEDVYPVSE